jgi:hypothetical protein
LLNERYQPAQSGPLFQEARVELEDGDAVLVKLNGTEANVLVLDDCNYRSYRSGGRYTYFCGHYRQSPAVIRPPHGGDWNVVVDLGGSGGKVEASVHVIH